MKKFDKFFITTFVAGLVAFSAVLAIPTQMAQALIGTIAIADNAITSPKIKDGEVKTQDLATAAVTKDKLNPTAVKLVTVVRQESRDLGPTVSAGVTVQCQSGEIATGGSGVISGEVRHIVLQGTKPEGNGWFALGFNNHETDTAQLTVYVVCAHLELGP